MADSDHVGTPKRYNSDSAVDGKDDESQLQQQSESEQDDCKPTTTDPELSLMSLPQILEEFDGFLDTLANTQDRSNSPQVPNPVQSLSQLVESMIEKYYEAKNTTTRFGRDPEADSSFLQAVTRISKLSIAFSDFPSNDSTASSLNQTSSILQKAMAFLDEEFRGLLEEPIRNSNHNNNNSISDQLTAMKTPKKTTKKSSSFNSISETDRCILPEPQSMTQNEEAEFPAFSPETISNMNRIASAMVSAGYENECIMVFSAFRRNAFRNAMHKFGCKIISIDDIHRMQWESLAGEITTWINTVRHYSTVLFSAERKLCESVFSDQPSISESLLTDLGRAAIIQFLNMAEAVVLTERSAEKLFKFLDMYEALGDLESTIPIPIPGDHEYSSDELINETETAKSLLGEAAVSIFCDLENSIRSDKGRTPLPSGAVHPLTRYVMNYLKYASEYRDTLEQVFQRCMLSKAATAMDHSINRPINNSNSENMESNKIQIPQQGKMEDGTPRTSPFAVQLMRVTDLLDANLEMKSKLYRDPALRYVFLMNNGRYIVQKIKGSTETHELVGDNWRRKRSSDLRQYHKSYQRETWSKVLKCLSFDGLQVNGKVSKPVLKERFKNFNTMFDEIHKTQSTWVVCDEQLQSELRVSISAVMIPAYRSFMGRFKQYLDSGRQTEKYIKHQPEDIETLIDDLFDGNPTSMTRRRT
ncbi:Exocyst subunit Exo70 family protein [Quillaja saponaria]|uniref:Exocyst subunit Exo70 family protein n=1 Tax=Quillaja saponaria TaxID=32244 RepID=A0AAD7KTL4_QUISA|nr:Exocyst subunit Exo70 family protein [Quillaja saponaria]